MEFPAAERIAAWLGLTYPCGNEANIIELPKRSPYVALLNSTPIQADSELSHSFVYKTPVYAAISKD